MEMRLEQAPEPAVEQETRLSWVQIVARNFSATMASSVIDSVLRFVAYGYLARQLGPEVFGINAYMYGITFFFGSLSDFGLRILGARDIASRPDKVEKLVSTILSLKLVFVTVAYLLMQSFIILTRDSVQVRWLAVIYGLSLFGFNTADWILMGLEQMHYLGIARIINGVGVLVLVLVFIHGPEDLLLVGGIESLTFMLAGGYLLYIASKKVRIRLSFQFVEWGKIFKETFPLGISLIMIRLGFSLPVLVLGLLSSDYEAGIYKAVSLLPNFLERSTILLTEALLPTLSRIYIQSEQRFAGIVIRIQKYMSIGGVFLAAPAVLWVAPFLPRVFGENFRDGLGTFQVLMIVSAIVFSSQCLMRLLPACHAQRQYAFVMSSRTVALLIFSLVLVKRGSMGEAWAVLLAECCVLGLSVYFFQKEFPSSQLFSNLLKIAVSSGTFVLAIWSLKGHLFIAIPVGAAVYGLMLVVLRALSFDDVEFAVPRRLAFQVRWPHADTDPDRGGVKQ